MITDFTNDFKSTLSGTSVRSEATDELTGGARISFVFNEIYGKTVLAMDPFDEIKDISIRTILYNSSGASPSIFVNSSAFEILIKQQIKRLEEPSLKCCGMIYDELLRILNSLIQKPIFRRFPALQDKFKQVVVNYFDSCMQPTQKLCSDLIR